MYAMLPDPIPESGVRDYVCTYIECRGDVTQECHARMRARNSENLAGQRSTSYYCGVSDARHDADTYYAYV